MQRHGGELPDPSGMGDELERILRGGGFGARPDPAPAQPQSPTLDERLRERLKPFIMGFVQYVNPNDVNSPDQREVARQTRAKFDNWKRGRLGIMRSIGADETDRAIMSNLTLKDVAILVEEQARVSKEASGRKTP